MNRTEIMTFLTARKEPSGIVRISLEEIAQVIGASTSTASRELIALEQSGAIRRLQKGGRGKVSVYQVLQGKVPDPDTVTRIQMQAQQLVRELAMLREELERAQEGASRARSIESRIISRVDLPGDMEQWILRKQ